MENIYTAYTKVIQGVTFYFVKKYKTFPELKEVPDILESYGMHSDFDRACSIAMIDDKLIKEQLLNKLQNDPNKAKVIHLNAPKNITAHNNEEPQRKDAQKAI